jgi:ABC-type lipoprotein export system ATPase subunit
MIKITNLTKRFGKIVALDNINLELPDTGLVGFTGFSGSGKTTMLNIIAGLDKPTEGDVEIGGTHLADLTEKGLNHYRQKVVGYDFQNATLIKSLSVRKNIELPLIVAGFSRKDIDARVAEVAELVQLKPELLKSKPMNLSGGEMERVQIARALTMNPPVLIVDEPAAMLDWENREKMILILKNISRERLVLWVSHHIPFIDKYADREIVIEGGKVKKDIIHKHKPEQAEKPAEAINYAAIKEKSKRGKSWLALFPLAVGNVFARKFMAAFVALVSCLGVGAFALVLAIENGVTAEITKMQDATIQTTPLIVSTIHRTQTNQGDNNFNGYFESIYYINENIISNEFVENVIDKIPAENVNFIWKKRVMDMHLISQPNGLEPNLVFQPMPESTVVKRYYTLVGAHSSWPTNFNDIVLVVDENGHIPADVARAFGITDKNITIDGFMARMNPTHENYAPLKIVSNNDYYEKIDNAFFRRWPADEVHHYSPHQELNITGVIRATGELQFLKSGLAYTDDLYAEIVSRNAMTYDEIISAPEIQITGENLIGKFQARAFAVGGAAVLAERESIENPADKAAILKMFGAVNGVFEIEIYVAGKAGKAGIEALIAEWNAAQTVNENKITTADFSGFATVEVIKQTDEFISVLRVLATIACIMSIFAFGGMCYIVIRERTVEIGILRAIGVSSGKVRFMFFIEIFFVSLATGIFACLLNICANAIINPILSGSFGFAGKLAVIAWWHPLALLTLAVATGIIAAFVPSLVATRKTPASALRHY